MTESFQVLFERVSSYDDDTTFEILSSFLFGREEGVDRSRSGREDGGATELMGLLRDEVGEGGVGWEERERVVDGGCYKVGLWI